MTFTYPSAWVDITCAEQVDGVQRFDIGSHIFNPLLQVISWIVGDVVVLGAIFGLPHHEVQICLGSRLVHEVVSEDCGIVPACNMPVSARLQPKLIAATDCAT